jgi:hypothetical protein
MLSRALPPQGGHRQHFLSKLKGKKLTGCRRVEEEEEEEEEELARLLPSPKSTLTQADLSAALLLVNTQVVRVGLCVCVLVFYAPSR